MKLALVANLEGTTGCKNCRFARSGNRLIDAASLSHGSAIHCELFFEWCPGGSDHPERLGACVEAELAVQ